MPPNNSLSSKMKSLRNSVFGQGATDDISVKLNAIKSDVFGGIWDLNKDTKIDKVINSLSNDVIDKDIYNYGEMLKSIMTKNIDSKSFDQALTANIFQSPDLRNRLSRYADFDDITEYIPYCARALKVIADGITSPDKITKDIINILEDKVHNETHKEKITKLREIKNTLNLDDSIYEVILDTLKYGDQFVEICHFNSDEVPITKIMLTESGNDEHLLEMMNYVNQPTKVVCSQKIINEFGLEEDREVTKNITLEITQDEDPGYDDNMILTESKKKEKSTVISDVRIIVHRPDRVIKIQSEKYKMNLGYLILPDIYGDNANNTIFGADSKNQMYLPMRGSMVNLVSGFDELYMKIIRLIKKYLNEDKIKVNKKELDMMLSRAISDVEHVTEMKIRYVPPERMEHFHLGTAKFFPYGEGIFQKSIFSAKLLIAFETAVIIKRISDSSEKRIIYVETTLPRKTRNTIESIKEALKKRKHSIDTFGSISSIPSTITSYEDYYIPQRNGKKFVEFDTLAPTVSLSSVTEDLKFFRDNIISSLDVPPAFLNLEESVSNKSLLAHESSLFAETILSYQKTFTRHLTSFFTKVYKYVYSEKLPLEISITFSPPTALQLEKESENYTTIVQIINSLSQELGINKEYLKRKYLPFEWEKVEEFDVKQKIDDMQKVAPPPGGGEGGDPGGGGGPGDMNF